MNIAVDVNGILEVSGMGYHIRSFVNSLVKIKGNNYLLYSCHSGKRKRFSPDFLNGLDNVSFKHVPFPNTITTFLDFKVNWYFTEKILKKFKIALFYGPSGIVPPFGRIKSVVTIHHYYPVGGEFFSKNVTWKDKLFFNATKDSILNSDAVVAISEYTRRTILEEFAVSENKIKVIYPGGPDPVFKRIKECEYPFERQLPEKYLLFTGPISERKNLTGLLRAFAKIVEKRKDISLVVSGGGSEKYMAFIAEEVKSLNIEDRVVFLGVVSKFQLRFLYNNALALAYPSFYEGFGYPPLEAMACGCPVVASNVTSMPEVLGDAALLVNPGSTEELVAALERVLNDEKLKGSIIQKGYVRARKFSWDKFASEVLSVCRMV